MFQNVLQIHLTIRGKLERQVLSDPGLQFWSYNYCLVIKCSLI